MQNFMLKPCCRNLFKIADLFCHLASSSNRTARLHTRQSWLKTGLLFATNCSKFIGKHEWPPNSLDLNPLDYHVWGTMLERYKSFQPSRRTSMSSRKFCSWYGTSCHAQDSINKVILSLCESWWWTLRTYRGTLKRTTCEILVFVITVNVS